MEFVKYDELTVEELKKTFSKNTDELLECMNKINEELLALPEILSTPKSNKKIQDILKQTGDDIEIINKEKEKIGDNFNVVISAYNNFNIGVKEIVGDINE